MYYISNSEWDQVLEKVPEEYRKHVQEEVQSLLYDAHHDAYNEGFDSGLESSSHYVDSWIRDGEYDDEIKTRASKIGYVALEEMNTVIETGNDMLQGFHRKHHRDSAYHWTFCGKCSQIEY